MNKSRLVKALAISIIVIGTCIKLSSCSGGSHNESKSSTVKKESSITNKVKIVRTKKEITYSMHYLDVTIKNISNEDLSGKPIPIMIRYADGTVERDEISTPNFRSGDTQSWALKSKKDGFGSIEVISCELAPN